MNIKNFLIARQQTIIILLGYVLVAGLGFGLGQMSGSEQAAPQIRVEQAFLPLNNTPEPQSNQSANSQNQQPNTQPSQNSGELDCKGQIKGNISGSNKIYHMPGGSSYNRTKPEACFGTEAEAQAEGFRKANN
jgi:hypothetical protein